MLCLGVCNNSTANPVITATGNEQIGNKTECALLGMSHHMGYDYKRWRMKDKIVKAFPFSSLEKKMATVYADEKKTYTFVKGGPDFLLDYCSQYINIDGGISKINQEYLDHLQGVIE
jgi:magnesium-transporting ATPase (P-type)